jgi:energy-coupling factor transport system ATP-binding protein
VLSAVSLHYRYPGFARPVLSGIDLNVPPGEWVAVMGGNGSGKSTLLGVLAGMLRPASGSVSIDGRDLADVGSPSERACLVGRVFQDPETQMVAPSVERELAFGLEHSGMPAPEMRARVEEALEEFDLGRFRNRAPHTLSGGEKQRVALAAVLAMRPRVLLLDEPSALLDARARRGLAGMLAALRSRGDTAVVHATGSPEEALAADRLLVLGDGRVVESGRPAAILASPAACEPWRVRRPGAARLADRLADRGFRMDPVPVTLAGFVSAWQSPAPDGGRREGTEG